MQGTVGLNRNKAPLSPQALTLSLNDLCVIAIDFWDNHRNVRGASVCAVVAHNRTFGLSIELLQGFYFILFHVNGAKDEVTAIRYFFDVFLGV